MWIKKNGFQARVRQRGLGHWELAHHLPGFPRASLNSVRCPPLTVLTKWDEPSSRKPLVLAFMLPPSPSLPRLDHSTVIDWVTASV